jgi:hypothetical protein
MWEGRKDGLVRHMLVGMSMYILASLQVKRHVEEGRGGLPVEHEGGRGNGLSWR